MTKQTILSLASAIGVVVASIYSAPAQSAPDTGWTSLFNGKNLDGWEIQLRGQAKKADPNKLVQIENGALHFYKDAAADSQQPFGYIATRQAYSHYRLRLEFKWGEKRFAPRAKSRRDSGLLYHVTGADKVWPDSVEYQIQEEDVGDIYAVSTRVVSSVDPQTTNILTKISTNRTSGVVRTNISAQPKFLETERGGVAFLQGRSGTSLRVIRDPLNEKDGWNLVEIDVAGDRAVHLLNGKVNNRCSKIEQFADGIWTTLDHGRIALQLEGAEVLYRNIEIQELKP